MRNEQAVKTMSEAGMRPWVSLIVWLAVCYGVSVVGSLATVHAVRTWYQGLAKPGLNPPDWVFAPVWTVLYGLMAVAVWRVWLGPKSVRRRQAVILFCVQLAANLLWSFLFFGAHRLETAAVEITVLWLLIAATMALFFQLRRAAGWMMVPYLAWVTFAGYLNWAIWVLNRG